MLFRPRYGRVGWVALPYYWLFELARAAARAVGIVLVPLGLAFGVVNVPYAVLFLVLAYGYAILVTLAAMAPRSGPSTATTGGATSASTVAAAVLENIGYRQMTVLWRLEGWWASLRGKKQVWGVMTRTGFEEEAA